MKKLHWAIITLAVIMGILLLGAIGLFIYQSIVDDIAVFDLTNFIFTTAFSLAAIAISLFEVIRDINKDKEAIQKQEKNDHAKKAVADMLAQKAAEITSIKQQYATDIIGDFPTYSDLSLSDMCALFENFYTNEATSADCTVSLKSATFAIKHYADSVEDVMGIVFENGNYLSAATSTLANFMCESIKDIHAQLTHFNELSKINYWTILNIEKNDAYGSDETQKRKYLYDECCTVCVYYNELLETVLRNYKWLSILCNSIN